MADHQVESHIKKESEGSHFSRTTTIFHASKGFLNNCLHVLCGAFVWCITRHSQIKNKPILERKMIPLRDRSIFMGMRDQEMSGGQLRNLPWPC